MAALLLTTLLTAALAAVPCLGAAAEETTVNLPVTENLQTDKGELVGTTYNGNSQIYENDLLQMIEDADGSLTIQVMKYGLNIPASVLEKALEQEKKLIIEIFQPGFCVEVAQRGEFDGMERMPLYGDNQYVLPAEILDQLRDSGKTLFFTSPGVEAQPTYSWFFDGTEITDTTDIDLHVQFYEGPYNNTQGLGLPSMLQGLPDDVPSMLFDFAHSGIVPGGTTLSVTASAELAKEGYLYYVNEEDGTFEYIGQTSAEIENEYFCTLNVSGITHCSYYLVTARELTGDNVVVPGGPSDPDEPDNPLPPDTPEDTENPVETDQPAGTDNSDGQAVQDVQVEKVEQSGAAVQTGDNTPVLLAAFAAVLSLTAVIAVLRKKL